MNEEDRMLQSHTTESERRGELLRDALVALERAGHRLCVLHGYRDYPDRIDSDVDAISEDPRQIPRILYERGAAQVVQAVYTRATGGFYYVLQRWHEGRPIFISLHVYRDCRREGRVFFEGEEFLSSSRTYKFFRVPPPDLEFAAYLVKRMFHVTLSEEQGDRLGELYGQDSGGCVKRLLDLLPETEAKLVAGAAQSGNWSPVRRDFERLRRAMVEMDGKRGRLRNRAEDYFETARQALAPPGLTVAVLGVDGAGKSTVLSRIERDLAQAFWSVKRYHGRALESPLRWTKRVRQQRELRRKEIEHAAAAGTEYRPPRNPHYRPQRNPVLSLVKLALWWADYTVLGYGRDIYPRLRRAGLVLLDRHYHDLLVDPIRHRYGGPMWMARAAGRFFPQPHLVVLLDAPPEVLHARKQEVPLEETARQREAYLEVVRRLPNGHVVDASRRPDEVASEVEQIVLGYMAERVAGRALLR